jgi:hypothetical protein
MSDDPDCSHPLTPVRDAEALEALVRATAWMQRLGHSGGSDVGKSKKRHSRRETQFQ